MSSLKSRIAIMTMLAVVAYSAASGITDLWMCVGQTVPLPMPPAPVPKAQEKIVDVSQKPTESLPFGLANDFGKIKSGIIASYALGIINNTDAPLRIISVRANSANHLRAKMSKLELQPNEEGKLEISVNTRYFVGRKSTALWLEMQSGDKTMETFIQVTAESIED